MLGLCQFLITSTYASEIWGNAKAPPIDNLQNRAIIFYLGFINSVLCLLLPSCDKRILRMLKFWNHMIKMDSSRLA